MVKQLSSYKFYLTIECEIHSKYQQTSNSSTGKELQQDVIETFKLSECMRVIFNYYVQNHA